MTARRPRGPVERVGYAVGVALVLVPALALLVVLSLWAWRWVIGALAPC